MLLRALFTGRYVYSGFQEACGTPIHYKTLLSDVTQLETTIDTSYFKKGLQLRFPACIDREGTDSLVLHK